MVSMREREVRRVFGFVARQSQAYCICRYHRAPFLSGKHTYCNMFFVDLAYFGRGLFAEAFIFRDVRFLLDV